MSLETMRSALLWCTVINYGLLILWFIVFALRHDWLHRLWGRWFHLSREQFDALHYGGILLFKLGVLLFNLVPCVALWLVG
jgi:hypothetical protein